MGLIYIIENYIDDYLAEQCDPYASIDVDHLKSDVFDYFVSRCHTISAGDIIGTLIDNGIIDLLTNDLCGDLENFFNDTVDNHMNSLKVK